jgi:hypothetical protein
MKCYVRIVLGIVSDLEMIESNRKSWALWHMSIIPATWEAEIWRIAVQTQPQQKDRETQSQPTVHGVCHPSYVGSIKKRIMVQDGRGIK